jgi:hypothetical protein
MEWQNCSTLPPASLSGEGLEGRVAAVSAQELNWLCGFALVGAPKRVCVPTPLLPRFDKLVE